MQVINFEIVKGTTNDAACFIQFLYDIREKMETKEWFYLDSPDVMKNMIEGGTLEFWLAKDGSQIAAVFDLVRPGLCEINYGYDLRLSDEELKRVINMDNVAVHPDYRGNALQTKLIKYVEEQLCNEGNFILLCTIHPENTYSLRNVISQGYKIQKRIEKYGSVRYLLRKDI